MLHLTLPEQELFNEDTQEFLEYPLVELQMEHSLVSLSKWEEKYEKPFLTAADKTPEEMLDYVFCMIYNEDVDESVLLRLNAEHLGAIKDYISAKKTATWFSDEAKSLGNRETITSELIYYWLISLQIPMEAQHWHLNRLFTLIRVFIEKQKDPKKNRRPQREVVEQQARLNEQRRAALGTRG